jgi:hypothetical protein
VKYERRVCDVKYERRVCDVKYERRVCDVKYERRVCDVKYERRVWNRFPAWLQAISSAYHLEMIRAWMLDVGRLRRSNLSRAVSVCIFSKIIWS